ncbi:MAG: Crp/Fnr family transcriptional regulator [Pseudomonadota bacterium]
MSSSEFDPDWLGARLQANAPLDDAELAALRSLHATVRPFEPGQYLLREGDRPKQCSFLVSGFVYRHKIVGDGGRQIVAVHLPRDFVDVQQFLLATADHNVQALTAGALLMVPSEDLIAISRRHPGIAIALFHQMLIEASIAREWMTNTNRRDSRARTAHLLCELAVRSEAAGLGPRENFSLPMTQEQLGDALGLTAVHVNRTLKALSAEKLIERDRRSVRIIDWPALCYIGDFATSYLHLGGQD